MNLFSLQHNTVVFCSHFWIIPDRGKFCNEYPKTHFFTMDKILTQICWTTNKKTRSTQEKKQWQSWCSSWKPSCCSSNKSVSFWREHFCSHFMKLCFVLRCSFSLFGNAVKKKDCNKSRCFRLVIVTKITATCYFCWGKFQLEKLTIHGIWYTEGNYFLCCRNSK